MKIMDQLFYLIVVIVLRFEISRCHYIADDNSLEIQPYLERGYSPIDSWASQYYYMKDDCDLCESHGPIHLVYTHNHLICHSEAELQSPDYCHDCCLTEFDKCKYIKNSERISPNFQISQNLVKEAVFRFKQQRYRRPEACLTCVSMSCDFVNDMEDKIYCIRNMYVCGCPYLIDAPQLKQKGIFLNSRHQQSQSQQQEEVSAQQQTNNQQDDVKVTVMETKSKNLDDQMADDQKDDQNDDQKDDQKDDQDSHHVANRRQIRQKLNDRSKKEQNDDQDQQDDGQENETQQKKKHTDKKRRYSTDEQDDESYDDEQQDTDFQDGYRYRPNRRKL